MTKPESPIGEKPEAMRVWLLGGFRVSVGARIIEDATWRLKKTASLMKLLALAPSHRLHREQAMDLLWPHLERRAAFGLMGNLTRREREVTVLVAWGLTNRQISTQLSISGRTAGNHVAKILRKLGLRSRAQIAAHAGVVVAAEEIAPGMVASDG
jgi:DNA-binding CsgD family transcriptional regulator